MPKHHLPTRLAAFGELQSLLLARSTHTLRLEQLGRLRLRKRRIRNRHPLQFRSANQQLTSPQRLVRHSRE